MFKIINSQKLGQVIFFIDDEDEYLVDQYQWYVTDNQQIIGMVEGQLTSLPRYILGYDGALCIDHIDRNGLNNHKYNYRIASQKQNLQNRNKFRTYARRPTTSKYKGVTYNWDALRWKAQLGNEGEVVYLGDFDTEIEAAIAYNQAASSYFNQFAVLNKIPPFINGDLLLPMNFENLIRLMLCVRDERIFRAVEKFIECNPRVDQIYIPDPLDFKSQTLAALLIRIIANRLSQDSPEWSKITNLSNDDELLNWLEFFSNQNE